MGTEATLGAQVALVKDAPADTGTIKKTVHHTVCYGEHTGGTRVAKTFMLMGENSEVLMWRFILCQVQEDQQFVHLCFSVSC